MWVGDVVAERFEIVRPIGSGGMGSVFLAADRVAGGAVALKVLDLTDEAARERFGREVRVLSELTHPGIVRYVAHGETAEHRPFLAMELLDGEDLAERLARGRPTTAESVGLVREAAEALAFAHGKGIVHRDVKPSNLFLVESDGERLKVLDFGIARAGLQTRGLTQTGTLLGTVGYMAPEQATASGAVDARADVFSLGCVLFECLAGRPAFTGDHVVAILAKVLVEEAPRLRQLCPELPVALEELVAQMLAKEPAHRPPDAAALIGRLESVTTGAVTGSAEPRVTAAPASLGAAERRMAAVILVEGDAAASAHAATATPDQGSAELEGVSQIASRHGAELRWLLGGTLLLTLQDSGVASDLSARAAQAALELARALPDYRIAVATSLAEAHEERFIGPAIDRAAALLRSARVDGHRVLVDDVTAGLLGAQFEVVEAGGAHALVSVRQGATRPRTLLGRPTPCVGRDRELGLLTATLDECIDERAARCVLVTAPAGGGKSRLGRELMDRVRERRALRIFFARGAPVSADAVGTVLSLLVRDATSAREAEPPSVQYARIREHALGLRLEAPGRVAEFLGELVGAPSPESPTDQLLAARSNPDLMRYWLRRSSEEWLEAECAAGPVLLMLEDVHWADASTITFVGSVLRKLASAPLFVLALGRPEARERTAWPGTQEVSLPGLGRRASEELARSVLGSDVPGETIARIVMLAEGNAFFLEELIRSIASGATTLPETVVAMAQARLEQQSATARRLLRAASVFGETFWEGGVVAVAGDTSRDGVRDGIDGLVASELLESVESSTIAGEREYAFRHSLLREAAYASLTEVDRATGHGLAGTWLEARGEDPLVVANHFEASGDLARAAEWVGMAAAKLFDQTFDGKSFLPVVELAERGIRLGARGEAQGKLRAIQALVAVASAGPELLEYGLEAMSLLPEGSTLWYVAAGSASVAMTDPRPIAEMLRVALDETKDVPPVGSVGWAIHTLVVTLTLLGDPSTAGTVLRRADTARERATTREPAFVAWLLTSHHFLDRYRDEPSGSLRAAREAEAIFEATGEGIGWPFGAYYLGIALCDAGDLGLAEKELRKARERLAATLNHTVGGMAETLLAWIRLRHGEVPVASQNPRFAGSLGASIRGGVLEAGPCRGAPSRGRARRRRGTRPSCRRGGESDATFCSIPALRACTSAARSRRRKRRPRLFGSGPGLGASPRSGPDHAVPNPPHPRGGPRDPRRPRGSRRSLPRRARPHPPHRGLLRRPRARALLHDEPSSQRADARAGEGVARGVVT